MSLFRLLLVMTLAAQAPRDQVTPSARGTATLTGRVIVVANGQSTPVRRARVGVRHSGGAGWTADTDADGRFQIHELPAGTLVVLAEKGGFVPSDPLSRPAATPTLVEIADGRSTAVDIVMVRGAAIEGRVVRETGQPAVNVVVSAVRVAYGPYGPQPSAIRQAKTDDRGRFRVHTLPAGEYYVQAEVDPLEAITRSVPGDPAARMARTYFPGTARIAEARRVVVATGEERTGVDFTIGSVTTTVVAGHVVPSSGNKPDAISIRLQRVGGPPGEVRGVLWPEGKGFEFRVVPPGDYWLVAASRSSPGGDLEFASQRLSVASQPYKDLRIITAPAARCTGRVELDSGTAAVPVGTTVVAHQTEFEVPLPAGVDAAMVTRAPVDAAGGFTFPALFGPRVLRIDRVPDSWALRSVRLDGIDITDRPTDFRGGTPACTLSLGVTTTAASIGGVVRDERGRPVPQARVVILPEDLNRRGPLSRSVKSAETGSDGRFRITSVLPGRYGIAAVPYLDEGAWENLETLARLQPMSVAQSIAANDRAEVTLTLRPLR